MLCISKETLVVSGDLLHKTLVRADYSEKEEQLLFLLVAAFAIFPQQN